MSATATPDLFEYCAQLSYPRAVGYKTDTPETSRTAAHSTDARSLRLAVERELRKGGNKTADEIAATLGQSMLAIRPRCSELLRLGKIRDSGQRRPNASGKNAAAWEIV